MAVVPLTSMPAAGPLTGSEILYAQQAGVDVKVIIPAVVFNVKAYGAIGDGVTNDTAAFAAASAALQANNGGTLLVPPGTYIVGAQTFANGTGHGYSYLASNIIYVTGCTRSISIIGYGAILKIAAGLKFGSFNPTTGAASNPGFSISAVTWASTSGGQITCTTSGSPTISAGNTLTVSGGTNTGVGGNTAFNSEFTVFSYSAPTLILTAAAPAGYYGTLAGSPKINMINGYTVVDDAADVGAIIKVTNCTAPVEIMGFELDGNMANLTLGGMWGDTGWQRTAIGIDVEGNASVTVQDVYTHHHGQDGIYVGFASSPATETTAITPHRFRNVRSEFNARQGLSWVGGSHLSMVDCRFNSTGQGTFNSAPGAGIDVEPTGSVCRNWDCENCEFVNNAGYGITMAGDAGNFRIARSKMVGYGATYCNAPKTRFKDCLLVGRVVQPYSSTTNPNYSTVFDACTFSDETIYGGVALGLIIMDFSSGTNVKLFNCQINASQDKAANIQGAYIKDTVFTISAGTGFIANNDWCIFLNNSILDGVTVVDNITVNIPAAGYYVSLSGAISKGLNQIISASNKLYWYGMGYSGGYFILGGNENSAPTLAAATGLIPIGYSTAATAGSFALSSGHLTGFAPGGGTMCVLDLTGAITAAANATLCTATSLLSDIPAAQDGQSYILRVRNTAGSGAGIWTMVTNTGWTLFGTMTIAVGAWRDFLIVLTASATTATFRSIGSGTN